MKKKAILLFLVCTLMIVFVGCDSKTEVMNQENDIANNMAIQIVDDMGDTVSLDKPAERIISLYSAHTENLYHLGLGDKIIGVGTSDIYPVDVLSKQVFDYKSDPENIIAAQPDLVLVRPFINRKVPDFINTLKQSGIKVASLYPEAYDKFDEYVEKIGKLTGSEDIAKEKLEKFYSDIENVKKLMANIEDKKTVYFESSENGYKTVTADSMPGLAIGYAGGINVAKDVGPYKDGSSIAEFGIERILENAENIDVFISQRGVMNAGGNYHSIVIRPGFDTLKAVKEDRVHIINQKLISSPTFRYAKGVKEMARLIYPEQMNDISIYASDEYVNRRELAKIIVKFTDKETYIPSLKYYRSKHKGHTYGMFKDISYQDNDYDMIETATMAGYIKGYVENNDEYYKPNEYITRDDLAQVLYLVGEIETDKSVEFKDGNEVVNLRCAKTLVGADILDVENDMFRPQEKVTYNELIKALSYIKKVK